MIKPVTAIGMAVGISVLLLLCFSPVLVSATWCDANYDKKAPILINNTEGSAQTYYQVELNYTYDSDMNANFSDARVYNESDCSLIPLWNESAEDSSWNKIRFNATNIPASTWTNDTYYLYYDYASASSVSNIKNTFLFGDDLEDGTLNNWQQVGNGIIDSTYVYDGDYSIKVQGLITCDVTESERAISNNFSATHNLVFDYWFQSRTYGGGNQPMSYLFEDSNNFVEFWVDCQPHGAVLTRFGVTESGSSIGWTANAGDFSANTWYHTKIVVNGNNIKWYLDTVDATTLIGEMTNAAIANLDFINVHVIGRCSCGYYDVIRVRKYASPEPTAQLGTEESQPPSGPTLNIGNATNTKYDWGQDWNSNFSANVTYHNASNVWMNLTNTEFTNTSLGDLNLTLNEWVNESHNVAAPVTNISVTVTLNSPTSGATNDTDTFWYEITKRTNTATMDSDATQSKLEGEDFFIGATCNEEYGDTFYGAADLLEDGVFQATTSPIINYVHFTWNESSVGVYNYTVRFYNTSHYDNATTPTYTNVTVTLAPFNTTIYKGYNLVGYIGTEDGSAEVWVTDIIYSNYLTVLEKAGTNYFRTHTKGFTINNFTTTHGYGYYIFATSGSVYERTGISAFSYNTTLETGWNIIGWSNSTEIDAEELSNVVGSNCSYVADLDSDGEIIVHTKGFSTNNFNVVKGRAYFVHVNKAMEWGRNA